MKIISRLWLTYRDLAFIKMTIDLEYFKDNFFGYSKNRLPVKFRETKEVISCVDCSGIGRRSKEELTDYHKSEYHTFYSDCKSCNGEGRLILTKIYLTFGDLPYKPSRKVSLHNILFDQDTKPYTKEEAKG